MVEPGIVLFREYDDANADTFAAQVKVVQELGEPFGAYTVIVDLREARNRPRTEMVQEILRSIRSCGVHWATIQSTSLPIRAIAQFIIRRVVGDNVSTHATKEEAVAACRLALEAQLRAAT